jgi:glucokinase
MRDMLLAGDVGGTKTVLALVDAEGGPGAPVVTGAFESRRYDGLEPILREFLDGASGRVRHAAFAVAGPVLDGAALLTNLGWQVDTRTLTDDLALTSAVLVNDVQATAFAVPLLPPEAVTTLQAGHGDPHGVRAVIAPGTGLGEAYLVPSRGGYVARASEAGHSDFAPVDETQVELLRFLWRSTPHVSYEQVCSGQAIPDLYRFLLESGIEQEPAWLAEQLAQVDDQTPAIMASALRPGRDGAIGRRTVALFVEILAAEVGNAALRLLPMGGLYLGGGIPPRILPALRDPTFLRAFAAKGRMAELMASFPVHVILDPSAALAGAIAYARAEAQLAGADSSPTAATVR